jgi:hypothetical protein
MIVLRTSMWNHIRHLILSPSCAFVIGAIFIAIGWLDLNSTYSETLERYGAFVNVSAGITWMLVGIARSAAK